jgi:hypothetical protein
MCSFPVGIYGMGILIENAEQLTRGSHGPCGVVGGTKQNETETK